MRKKYKAELVDQITKREYSKELFEKFRGKPGILTAQCECGCTHFEVEGFGDFRTSLLQSDPCRRDNKLIFATKNSTYVFEILEELEVDKNA